MNCWHDSCTPASCAPIHAQLYLCSAVRLFMLLRLLRVQWSSAATVEDHSCSKLLTPEKPATQLRQPTSNPLAPSGARCRERREAERNLLCTCLSSHDVIA